MTKRVAKPIENDLDEELEDEIEEEAYEEDEEYYEERSRAIPVAVVSVALALFIALGWYAYRESSTPNSDELLTVEAEQTPIKEKPLDEGGMQFPNQDKSVYETIGDTGNSTNNAQIVDNTEAPVAIEPPMPADPNATASTAAPSMAVTPSEESVITPAPVAEETTSAPAAAPVTATENALAAPTTPVTTEAPLVKEQAPVVQKTETLAETPKATPAKKETAKVEPAKKPAATAKAASGSQSVQLGAFKSEAEAQAAWKKISSNPAVSGKSHSIQKADLGSKGIFYRLRVSGVDAAKTCASLAGKSPCMAVK